MKTKIVIMVDGGIVQAVYSNNTETKIVIIDNDNKGDDPEPTYISEAKEPDAISENMYELFSDASDPTEVEIRDVLKNRKF